MQANTVNLRSVLRWLTETKGLAAQEEWLQACIDWILSEETVDSEQTLRELVYEQWLHADLRDVVSQGCIPESVARQQKGQVRGRFVVQLQSVVDVSKPAYGQLQKLKGKSLDEADTPEKKNPEPKANRLLLLDLTDGVTDLKAMEYHPLSNLSQQQLLPGTKLVIQGELHHRLGVLMLGEGQIQVLGGTVEHLLETNSPRKVLARLLNNESLADGGPGVGRDGMNSDSNQTADTRAPPDSIAAFTTAPHPTPTLSLTRGHSENTDSARSSVAIATPPAPPPPAVTEREGARRRSSARTSEEVVDFVDGEVDFEDFEDFDDDDCDGDGVERMEEEMDVPGHEEWEEEEEEDDPINYSPIEQQLTASSSTRLPGGYGPSYSQTSNVGFSNRMEYAIAPKSKLSLRQQKSSKTRVCELEPVIGERRGKERARNPPVASVKPMQHQLLPQSGDKTPSSSLLTESELTEEPVVVRSVFEVENNSWKLHPFLKIKAHFVRVCEMLDHTSGSWKTSIMVADDKGAQIRVRLSDKILERLIGFSAQEFKDHINPNKHIAKIKLRAVEGFGHCMSSLDELDCFMVLARNALSTDFPTVIQLLDQ